MKKLLKNKFPEFVKNVKDNKFSIVECIQEKNLHQTIYTVIISDEYGINYMSWISESNSNFDIDLFEVI